MITHTIAVIMQLALAIDYAIIFSHRYQDECARFSTAREALEEALAKSILEISSSSLTTISGLVALMLMQFRLGYDLGMVLSKGIVCSLLAVFLLGLTLWGEAAVIALPFLKGYGYGLIAGFIYSSCGVNGIIYNILVILPGALVFAAVISAASREAFMNSLKLCRLLRSGDEPEGCASGLQLKRYFISMLWLLFLTVLACTVDMLLSLMLSWLFGF